MVRRQDQGAAACRIEAIPHQLRVFEPDTVREGRRIEPALRKDFGRQLTQVAVKTGFDVPAVGRVEFRQAPCKVAADQLATPAKGAEQPGHQPHGRVQDCKRRGLEQGFHGKNGADSRIRTADLLITNQLLYQLS